MSPNDRATRPASAICADDVEAALRGAVGWPPLPATKPRDESRSFIARVNGCGVRIQIDHIDGRLAGGITLMLQHLSPDAAEAVLRFLSGRNEPNGRTECP